MKRMTLIRLSLLLLMLLGNSQILNAQTVSGRDWNPTRLMPAVSASVSTVLQDWTYNDTDIYELSTIISSRIQLRSNIGLSVDISQATVDHDSLQRITGVTDLRLGINYLAEFESSRLLFTINGNLPTGKRDLSKWAYDAAFPMGLSHYDFHVPYFGRGLGVAPGIAWATSASETLAIGLGVTYHFRSGFEPHRSLPDKYNWGNEFSLTGTAQWQIMPLLGLSAELIFTSYGSDKINDKIVYAAGSRTVGRLGAHVRMGRNDLFATFRFRSVGTNNILEREALQPESIKSSTGLIGGNLRYRMRFSPFVLFDMEVQATRYLDTFDIQNIAPTQLIRYDELKPIDRLDVFSTGVYPTLVISPAFTIPLRFKYSLGDIDGLEVGAGLSVIF